MIDMRLLITKRLIAKGTDATLLSPKQYNVIDVVLSAVAALRSAAVAGFDQIFLFVGRIVFIRELPTTFWVPFPIAEYILAVVLTSFLWCKEANSPDAPNRTAFGEGSLSTLLAFDLSITLAELFAIPLTVLFEGLFSMSRSLFVRENPRLTDFSGLTAFRKRFSDAPLFLSLISCDCTATVLCNATCFTLLWREVWRTAH